MQSEPSAALEIELEARGYRPGFIRPPWYRVCRALGIHAPLPVTMSFAQHLLYGGVQTAFVFGVGLGLMYQLGCIRHFPLGLVVVLPVVLSGMNWWRYRRARHRLGR